MKKFIRSLISSILLISVFLNIVFAQTAPYLAGYNYYSDVKVQSLRNSSNPSIRENILAASFVGAVGGIGFGQTATPDMPVNSIKLKYDSDKSDGQRLSAIINEEKVTVPLYDWELGPIFLYADSKYCSCISLFGSTGDSELDESIKENKDIRYLVSYHPNFENTLIGLRLLQMDSVLTAGNFEDLPTDANEKIIFGAGERELWKRRSNDSFGKFTSMITDYQSYVICDLGDKVSIKFYINNNQLNLTGNFYIFFWRQKSYEEIEKMIPIVEKKYGVEVDFSLGNYMLKGTSYKNIEMAKEYIDHNSVIFLEKFSDEVFKNIHLLEEANPVVYNCVNKVMQYSAFFRYCNTKNPQNWTIIKEQIKKIKISPDIITPNIAK